MNENSLTRFILTLSSCRSKIILFAGNERSRNDTDTCLFFKFPFDKMRISFRAIKHGERDIMDETRSDYIFVLKLQTYTMLVTEGNEPR